VELELISTLLIEIVFILKIILALLFFHDDVSLIDPFLRTH